MHISNFVKSLFFVVYRVKSKNGIISCYRANKIFKN